MDDDRNDQEGGAGGIPVAPPVLGGVRSGPITAPEPTDPGPTDPGPTADPGPELPGGEPWASPTQIDIPVQPPASPFAEAFWVGAATSETPSTAGWAPPPGPAGPPIPPPPGVTAWPPYAPAPAAPARHAPMWLVVAVVAALVGGAAGAGIAEAVGRRLDHHGTPTVKVGTGAPGPALAGGA